MQNDAYRLSINLGQKKENNPKDVFFKWAITKGKLIVIAVELLALAALVYRFTVDQKIVDLNDQIKKQQLFIEAQASKERTYRNLQKRISTVQEVNQETESRIAFLQELLTITSQNSLVSSSFNLNENTVSIDGQASSVFSLNAFIAEIKKNSNVSTISMEELSTLDQGVRFRITIGLKPILSKT